MTFGDQLRQWRLEAKINQRDLAAQVGIDFTYLSKIENGRMPPPSEETIVRIAAALGKDVNVLLHLGSRVPNDVRPIISGSREAPALLRAISGLSDFEVRHLIDVAERIKQGGLVQGPTLPSDSDVSDAAANADGG